MYTSMQWENEGPGIFVICKGELPEIKNYPVRLEDEDGTINIRRNHLKKGYRLDF